MGRRAFRQLDLERALKAIQALGLANVAVRIDPRTGIMEIGPAILTSPPPVTLPDDDPSSDLEALARRNGYG